jgi:diadenosine tetraphosphatase ApaH/serine/threonine PP2A family protein phosphatase
MTLLALLSDVHANLFALDACVAHARGQGATAFAFLGDHVGYGAQPQQVVDRLQEFAAAGAIILRGNHDELAVRGGTGTSIGESAAAWTHERLSAAQRTFLAGLPLQQACGDALLVHASAHDPQAWVYVDEPIRAQLCMQAAAQADPGVRRVFCGHVHHQRLFYQGRGSGWMAFDPAAGVPVMLAPHRCWVATVGSAGQPRDGDTRAMYALWDRGSARLAFQRVAYDHRAAAAAIRSSGQPDDFARRLEEGR